MTNQVIPDAAAEAGKSAFYAHEKGTLQAMDDSIRAALEAALPYIQAQALVDAVDAFPLETIHAPDNAVVWMMRRADEIRVGHE